MATTIRVDPDDELPAILDRLPTRDVCVLVLPPHARALNSVVGAKLLARRAQALETRVAVVSEDRAVSAHVRAAGIPVAESVAEAARLLPAQLLFDEPTSPVAPPEETSPNGARPDEAHEAITMAYPALDTPETPADAPPEDIDSASRAGGTPPKGQSYRFVARQPTGTSPDAAPGDSGEAGDEAGDAERRAIRGHSGGARAARRGSRVTGTGAGATSTAGATGVSAADAHTAPPKSAPAGRAAARPSGRLHELLASEGLTRLLVPILLGVILLLLLLWLILAVLGALFNPSANLTVQQRAIPITAPNPVIVHTYLKAPPKKRAGPYVQLFTAAPREAGSVQLPVNGTQLLPGNVATGQVSLRNPAGQPVVVPAGSAFSTRLNKQTFVTTQDIIVPAAHLTFDGAEYGKASVRIKAAAGGSSGNVPAKTIENVLPPLNGSLIVTNTAPTTGGTDIHQKIPLQSDVDAAASKLFAQLEAKARQEISGLGGASGVEQHTLYPVHSLVQPQLNKGDTSATLALSVVLHAVYVRKADMQPLASAAIGPQPNLIPNSVTYTPTWRPDNSIALVAAARIAPPINPDAIKHAIEGLSTEDAKLYLDRQSQTTIATYHLDLSPFWANHVPADLSHIHITVQGPR